VGVGLGLREKARALAGLTKGAEVYVEGRLPDQGVRRFSCGLAGSVEADRRPSPARPGRQDFLFPQRALADGVDVGIAGVAGIVDDDAAALADRQSRCARQFAAWTDAGGVDPSVVETAFSWCCQLTLAK
jgi:hypothetical protein